MDYEKFQIFGQMPVTPDVLILPSELRYFIKVAAALRVNHFIYASLSSMYSSRVSLLNLKCWIGGLNKCEISSVGCDWLCVCQPWTTDQRSCGRNLQQAAHPAPLLRGRGEGQSLFGCSSGENLITLPETHQHW